MALRNTDEYSVWAEGSTATGSVSEGWAPIGDDSNVYISTFEGNSHTISNLYINRPSTSYVGLFGDVRGASIRNVGMEDVHVQGENYVGGLVGYSFVDSTITASYATGAVSGNSSVGGLVGFNHGAITASCATGDVTGSSSRVGGLVGWNNDGTITTSYATSAVTGTNDVGGLVGVSSHASAITFSYAMGAVTGEEYVGGLVGDNFRSVIIASYYDDAAVITGKTNTNANGAQSTAALQGPTVATGIYKRWAVDIEK